MKWYNNNGKRYMIVTSTLFLIFIIIIINCMYELCMSNYRRKIIFTLYAVVNKYKKPGAPWHHWTYLSASLPREEGKLPL